ncbi:MAG: endonuclease/exonuclease/phosphatase family protein [Phycisphaerales bacterium JB043]
MSDPEANATDPAGTTSPREGRARAVLRTCARIVCSLVLIFGALYVLMLWWRDRPYALDMSAQFAVHVGYLLTLVGVLHVITHRRVAVATCWLVLGMGCWVSVFTIATRAHHTQSCDTGPGIDASADPIELTILSYNIDAHHVQNERPFLELIERFDPDVLCFIESPYGMGRRVDPDQTRYPHRIHPEPGRFWNIEILSRVPFELPELMLENEDNASSFVRVRSPLLELDSGRRALLSVFHPASPRTEKLWRGSQNKLVRDATMMRAWNQGRCHPMIAIGDFNSTPFGRMHQVFARASGLRAHTRVFSGGTWPADLPRWLSLPIDSVWTSEGVEVEALHVGEGLPSDHRAIVTRLRIR